jgi:hypothetical protein
VVSARDGFVAVPVDIGAALASPVAYAEWALTFPAPEPAPRVRRPGRVRRKMAALASVAVAAGLALAGRVDGTRERLTAFWGVREAGR